MKKKRGKRTIAVATAAVCLSMALIAGCSASNSKGATVVGDSRSMTDWGALYPLEYQSFYSDYRFVKLDGRQHAHSNLVNKVNVWPVPGRPGSMNCMSCKSADMNTLYEKYGDNVFSMAYPTDPDYSGDATITIPGEAAIGDESITIWNCTTCHSNISDPKGSLGAYNVYWNSLAGSFKENVDTENAVCGQCHNVNDGYRFVVETTGKSLTKLDAYKYGYDADAWRKGFLENAAYTEGKTIGDIFRIDEKSGTVDQFVTHPDIEMFQNSTHQSLGITCTSCHMPTETAITGESYTSHSASMSPLNSEASLESCLTCHKTQGIENTQEMVKFVRGKQAAIVGPENQLLAKLTTLQGLITEHAKAGDVDEPTLDQARQLWSTAEFYYRWQHGGTATAGIKVAMYTTEGMMQYINRGIADCDEGIALFH